MYPACILPDDKPYPFVLETGDMEIWKIYEIYVRMYACT